MGLLLFGCGLLLGFKLSDINWKCHFFYKAGTGLAINIKGKSYLINHVRVDTK